MAGRDSLHPDLSPAHSTVVVSNCFDSRVTLDGYPPIPPSVPVKTHRKASGPSITFPQGEASSPPLVGVGLLWWCRPDHRRADWYVDEVVPRRERPVGVRGVISFGGKEDVESPGPRRVLGVDWNHQCCHVESTVGTLEKISSKDHWEPRDSPTTHDVFHPFRGTAAYFKRPKCTPHA
jgi:hypothetical protein